MAGRGRSTRAAARPSTAVALGAAARVALALTLAAAVAACSSGPSASTPTVTTETSPASALSPIPSAGDSSTVQRSAPGTAQGANPSPSLPSPPASPVPLPRPTTTSAPSGPTDQPPAFRSSISAIDGALAARMASSWRPGCPVPLEDLAYLTVSYIGFDGRVSEGELVVAAEAAEPVVAVFARLFELGYPIASLRLVDDFGGSDEASMAANNTSAFNCRPVTGSTTTFSEHSYGTAIDVNPVQNPYVSGDTVLPEAGRRFLDRPPDPGVLHAGDPVVQAFASIGWSWGGSWSGPVDYQHFSSTGR